LIEYDDLTGQCSCLSTFDAEHHLITVDRKCSEIIFDNDELKQNCTTLYRTGFIDFGNHLDKRRQAQNNSQLTIVFFLTVGGRRNLRQIKRLIRAIYSRQHYYLIHVDSVCIDCFHIFILVLLC
jgi:hypothetical protein